MGLLAAAAEDGSFALSGAQRAELVGVVDETAVVRRDLEANLLELSSALSKAGVTHRVLRGCAAAYLDYPASVQRTFRRVELLVPVPAFDDAAALFSAMGCVRRFAEPRPGFDRRFSMGTSFFTPEGHELVLRRTFVSGPYGMLVTPADLFSHSTPLQVGGRELLALGTEERFLHACFYARLGRGQSQLVLLRDVAQMVLTHALDIDSIETLSTSWKAESVVAEAVDLAWSTLKVVDIVHLSAWAATHRPERADRRRLRVYDRTYDYARNGAALSVSAVREIRPRRATLRFLRAVVLPDRAYLEGRYRGHLQPLVARHVRPERPPPAPRRALASGAGRRRGRRPQRRTARRRPRVGARYGRRPARLSRPSWHRTAPPGWSWSDRATSASRSPCGPWRPDSTWWGSTSTRPGSSDWPPGSSFVEDVADTRLHGAPALGALSTPRASPGAAPGSTSPSSTSPPPPRRQPQPVPRRGRGGHVGPAPAAAAPRSSWSPPRTPAPPRNWSPRSSRTARGSSPGPTSTSATAPSASTPGNPTWGLGQHPEGRLGRRTRRPSTPCAASTTASSTRRCAVSGTPGGRAHQAAREHLPAREHRAGQRAGDVRRRARHRRVGGHRRGVDQALRVPALHARARRRRPLPPHRPELPVVEGPAERSASRSASWSWPTTSTSTCPTTWSTASSWRSTARAGPSTAPRCCCSASPTSATPGDARESSGHRHRRAPGGAGSRRAGGRPPPGPRTRRRRAPSSS